MPVLIACSAVSGCATWSKHGAAPRAPEKIRVAVLPAAVEVRIKRLDRIETLPNAKHPPSNEAEAIGERMRAAADHITGEIEAGLGRSYFFEVAPDSAVRAALTARGIVSSSAPLSAAQIEGLGRALGVQAVLLTRLSGYGSIKKRWLVYLIGSGVVEGAVQGAVAAAAIGNPWLAAGIGAEEVASESLEWGGGAYLFSKFYSPVILEGRLVSASDGETLWSGTSMESGNRKAVKTLPKDEQRKREVRLRLTSDKAAALLVKKIDAKAWSNLKNAGRRSATPSRSSD